MSSFAHLAQNPTALMAVIFAATLAFMLPILFLIMGGSAKKIRERAEKVSTGTLSASQIKMQESLKKVQKDSEIKFLDKIAKSLPNLKKLRYRLEMSDTGLDVGKYMMISVAIALIIATAFFLKSPLPEAFGIFVGIIAGIWFPHIYLNMKISKKTLKFTKLFPDAIELIVRGLRSGLPVQESFKVISEEIGEPVAKEFGLIAQSIKLGVPLDKALNDEARRLKILEFDFFVTSLNLQRETGGNLAEILTNLANTIRQRFIMKLKVKAISSEARASAWIVGSLPFVVSGILYFVNPGYLDPLFYELKGNFILGGCFVSLGMGILVMKKMASFEI